MFSYNTLPMMTNILPELSLYQIHATAARPRGLLAFVKSTVIWAQTKFLYIDYLLERCWDSRI